jgi:intracellular multiplication protein IcmT
MAGNFSSDTHWRDSARTAKFFIVDARAAFPLFVFLMHIRFWTAELVIVSLVFFGILERYGFTIPVFFRWVRTTLAGPQKMSIPWWR